MRIRSALRPRELSLLFAPRTRLDACRYLYGKGPEFLMPPLPRAPVFHVRAHKLRRLDRSVCRRRHRKDSGEIDRLSSADPEIADGHGAPSAGHGAASPLQVWIQYGQEICLPLDKLSHVRQSNERTERNLPLIDTSVCDL